jgi:hypothetical protein
MNRNAPTGSGLTGAIPPRPFGPYQVGSRRGEVSKLSAIATSPLNPGDGAGVVVVGGVGVGGGVTTVVGVLVPVSGAVAGPDPLVPQDATTPRLTMKPARNTRRNSLFNNCFPARS